MRLTRACGCGDRPRLCSGPSLCLAKLQTAANAHHPCHLRSFIRYPSCFLPACVFDRCYASATKLHLCLKLAASVHLSTMGDPQYAKYPDLQLSQHIFQLSNPSASKPTRQTSLKYIQDAIQEHKMAPLYRHLAHPVDGILNVEGEGTAAQP